MAKHKNKHAGSQATPALQLLFDAHIPHTIHTYTAGTDHFGEHAAEVIDAEPERVFKTLVVDLTAGKGPKRQLAVCCVPVTGHLSLKKAALAFGVSKVSMADPHDAEKSSGYITGGISPLGQKHVLPTVVDEIALAADTIFVSGGKRGLSVELGALDLAKVLDVTFADIASD